MFSNGRECVFVCVHVTLIFYKGTVSVSSERSRFACFVFLWGITSRSTTMHRVNTQRKITAKREHRIKCDCKNETPALVSFFHDWPHTHCDLFFQSVCEASQSQREYRETRKPQININEASHGVSWPGPHTKKQMFAQRDVRRRSETSSITLPTCRSHLLKCTLCRYRAGECKGFVVFSCIMIKCIGNLSPIDASI